MTKTWCTPLGRGDGCAGKQARCQDQLASRAFRLAFYKYCRHRQTVHRARQTSREIIRGAWPLDLRDLRERERGSYRLSTWMLQTRVSAFTAGFTRGCALPDRDTRFLVGVNCPSSKCFLESWRVDGLRRGARDP